MRNSLFKLLILFDVFDELILISKFGAPLKFSTPPGNTRHPHPHPHATKPKATTAVKYHVTIDRSATNNNTESLAGK